MLPTRHLLLVPLLFSACPAVALNGQGNGFDEATLYTSLGPTLASGWSSQTLSGSEPGDLNAYRDARDDAAAFIASAGAIRGARLERALRDYQARELPVQLELAYAIVSLR
ncbi:DUF2388 domain-containing protein [Pseudomonas sp. UL073]|uniref:DUF2388 domain-containing protein n=1 Tax=Zestomonas insulae TaxID=2809017 RepID=A0ABS2IDY2_9GAMM|nr:DUF2388 domain-containing protein [Pseudomonas insulae]MBM7061306.1 DUF2388 domain-containing protein [Pseudomonas insulae]